MRVERRDYLTPPRNRFWRTSRIGTLLELWCPAIFRHTHIASYGGVPGAAALDAAERQNWETLLRTATVVLPRTHVAGIETAVEIHKALAPDDPWTLAGLIADGTIMLAGPRGACRSRRVGNQRRDIGGPFSWGLRTTRFAADLARKQFSQVAVVGCDVVASEALHYDRSDDVLILADEAIRAQSAAQLFAAWAKARALHCSEEFIDALPPRLKDALASELRGRVLVCKDWLSLKIDFDLEAFREGHPAGSSPLSTYPGSRLGNLIDNESRPRDVFLIGDDYCTDVLVGVVQAGTPGLIGETLSELPVGVALASALQEIRRRNPSVLVELLSSACGRLEGVAGILKLPAERAIGVSSTVVFDEWEELNSLVREHLLLDHDLDREVVVLGVHDEEDRLARRRNPRHAPPAVSVETQMTGWRERLRGYDRIEELVSDVAAVVAATPTNASFQFALRIVDVLNDVKSSHASALAERLVDLYASTFGYGSDTRPRIVELHREPELLGVLHRNLGEGTAKWRLWLKPFSAKELIGRAKREDVPSSYSSNEPVAVFDVPRMLAVHARNLLAQASAVSGTAAFEVLDAVVDIYVRESRAGLSVPTFRWPQTHSGTRFASDDTAPLLVSFGRLLATVPDLGRLLQRIDRARPSVLELAQIAWGARDTSAARVALVERLAPMVSPILNDPNGIALGEALDLAIALYNAGVFGAAEMAARKAVEITQQFKVGGQHEETAWHVLLATHAEQEKWDDLLSQASTAPKGASDEAVANLSAVAMLKKDDVGQAEQLLRTVLSRNPRSALALANMTAVQLAKKDWQGTVDAATSAEAVLGNDVPEVVFQNLAIAQHALRRMGEASTALSRLSAEMRRAPSVLELRLDLVRDGVIDATLPADIESLSGKDDVAFARLNQSFALVREQAGVATPAVAPLADPATATGADATAMRVATTVVFSEDRDLGYMRVLLAAHGHARVEVGSYLGSSSIEDVRHKAEGARAVYSDVAVLVHRDSDYLTDADLAAIEAQFRPLGIGFFRTAGVDVESYFCRVDHLVAVNDGIDESFIREMYAPALIACEATFRQKAIDGRLDVERKWRPGTGWDRAQCEAWASTLDFTDERWIHGKTLLAYLRGTFQAERNRGLYIERPSRFLVDPALLKLLE